MRPGWRLALDEQFQDHVELRPRLEFAETATGPDLLAVDTAAVPLQPVRLDGLTVVDDPAFPCDAAEGAKPARRDCKRNRRILWWLESSEEISKLRLDVVGSD